MRRQVWLLLLCGLPLVLASGCATRAVWGNDQLEAWNEPAAIPNVQLYAVPARNDFLVVYSEHSERHEKIRTRAYFLNESEPRLQAKNAPRFVDPRLVAGCPAVPVYDQTSPGIKTVAPGTTCAVMETNGIAFQLYRRGLAGGLPEKHWLPIYKTGWGSMSGRRYCRRRPWWIPPWLGEFFAGGHWPPRVRTLRWGNESKMKR